MVCTGFTPHHLDQALQYLHAHGDETTIIAGGTDLLVRYHNRLYDLKRILNIWDLNELKCIKIVEDEIEIGSLVTHTQLAGSAIIQQHVPVLAEAAHSIGAPQIRNRGTIGGNVANSSPAGDTLPALLALEADVVLKSLDRGERRIPVAEFFTGPGRNVLKRDELITAFRFNVPPEGYMGKFMKLGQRKALAISTVNAVVLMRMLENRVEEIRIALGAVAPTPLRARLAEDTLRCQVLGEDLLAKALEQIPHEIAPITDIRGSQQYRVEAAKALVSGAIRSILQKGGSVK